MYRAQRELVATALDALVRPGLLRFLARRRASSRLYHLLRADGVGRRRSWMLCRRTKLAARKLRSRGDALMEAEKALALELILS